MRIFTITTIFFYYNHSVYSQENSVCFQLGVFLSLCRIFKKKKGRGRKKNRIQNSEEKKVIRFGFKINRWNRVPVDNNYSMLTRVYSYFSLSLSLSAKAESRAPRSIELFKALEYHRWHEIPDVPYLARLIIVERVAIANTPCEWADWKIKEKRKKKERSVAW